MKIEDVKQAFDRFVEILSQFDLDNEPEVLVRSYRYNDESEVIRISGDYQRMLDNAYRQLRMPGISLRKKQFYDWQVKFCLDRLKYLNNNLEYLEDKNIV